MEGQLQLWGTLPTPFDEKGELDLAAMAHLLDYFGKRQLSGLVLLSEVAETHALSLEEQQKLLSLAGKRLQSKLPFWASIRAPSTRGAVALATHAEEVGAGGLLVGLERLPGIGYPELYRHLERIARATKLPFGLYVRPEDLAWSLAPEEQQTLLEHPRLTGVWVAEGGDAAVGWRRMKSDAFVWSANAFDLSSQAEAGVSGAACALTVLAPEPARAMADAVVSGDGARIRRLKSRLQSALSMLGPPDTSQKPRRLERWAEKIARRSLDGARLKPTAEPGLVKAALALQGHRLQSFVRPPLHQVTKDERSKLESVLKVCGLLG